MTKKESLSLDEFATAPRRQRPTVALSPVPAEAERLVGSGRMAEPTRVETEQRSGETSSDASKALRKMKRTRMKGASHFVNVNLDRDTKRRLKLASFNLDTSMQAIMEKAIRQYLDANGY